MMFWLACGASLLLGCQRLWELRLSRCHETQLKAQGAYEVGAEHFGAMRAVHILWLIAIPLEVFWRRPEPSLEVMSLGIALLLLGQILRYMAILTLGERWTVRVLVLPQAPLVTRGIYRFIRHPNYVGVVCELAGLPLVFGCYFTAIIISILNLMILTLRVKAEDAALRSEAAKIPRF